MLSKIAKKASETALATVLAVLILFYIGTSWIFPDPDDREWYYSG